MEDKLDIIIRNQEILNRNQVTIYKELLSQRKTKGQDFITNYLADLTGTVTSLVVLEDLCKGIKSLYS